MSPWYGISYGVVAAYISESIFTEVDHNTRREVVMKDVVKCPRSVKAV